MNGSTIVLTTSAVRSMEPFCEVEVRPGHRSSVGRSRDMSHRSLKEMDEVARREGGESAAL